MPELIFLSTFSLPQVGFMKPFKVHWKSEQSLGVLRRAAGVIKR
jgi:hypothetical protein